MKSLERFIDAHKVGFCLMPKGAAKLPALKFGVKLDVPVAVDNRCYRTAVEDQGSKPWCAAYSAAAFAENVLWRRDGRIRQVEPAPIYKWAKAHDGDPEGDGTTLTAALEGMLAATGATFDAKLCRVRLVRGEEDIKAAIHRFGCFLGGFMITREWYELKSGAAITGRKCDSYGGHAVLVCGYDKDKLYFENSWGKRWGTGGFGFIEWGAVKKQFMYGAVATHVLDGFR